MLGLPDLKIEADESHLAPVGRPRGRCRSYCCEPGDIRAVSAHHIYLSPTTSIAGEEDSSVSRPTGRHINRSVVSKPLFAGAVSIYYIDFDVSFDRARVYDPFAVARPCGLSILRLRVGYLCGHASVSVHDVNMLHAGAVAREGDLTSVGRPIGIEIVGWSIGKLVQFAFDAHNKYFEVTLSVSAKNKLGAVRRPRGLSVV